MNAPWTAVDTANAFRGTTVTTSANACPIERVPLAKFPKKPLVTTDAMTIKVSY